MSFVIQPIYPRNFGDESVPNDAWLEFDVVSDVAIVPADLNIGVNFGTPPDIPYPLSPDYYGATINKSFTSTTSGTLSSGFYDVLYWDGSALVFVAECAPTSAVTVLSSLQYRIRIQFNDPLNFGTEHTLRVTLGTQASDMWLKTRPRDFYSPALGDAQSAYESFLYTNNWSSSFPETWTLRSLVLASLDTRHPILAARRLVLMCLRREYGFSDLNSITEQIIAGYRSQIYNNVFSPRGIKDIAATLGTRAMAQAQRSLRELQAAAPSILPLEWIQPLYNAADFRQMDVTHRVFFTCALVNIATRAAYDGRI